MHKAICKLSRACSQILFVLTLSASAVAQIPASTIIQRLGYPPESRLLIIHSDDLGMSHSVNRATFLALEKGWITSASIMVPCPWFAEAAEFASRHPEMDFGLHLTFTSEWKSYRWGPVSPKPVPSLLDEQSYFPPSASVLAKQAKPDDVEQEMRAQIERARAAGVEFTHFDSHMGTLFKNPELYQVYQRVAHEYRVPNLLARAGSPRGRLRGRHGLELAFDTLIVSKDLQMRPLHRRKRWLKVYKSMLKSLKPGVYELIVHLGYDDAEMRAITGKQSWGAQWRQADFDLVSNSEFQRFLREENFILVTWKELARAMAPAEERKAMAPASSAPN